MSSLLKRPWFSWYKTRIQQMLITKTNDFRRHNKFEQVGRAANFMWTRILFSKCLWSLLLGSKRNPYINLCLSSGEIRPSSKLVAAQQHLLVVRTCRVSPPSTRSTLWNSVSRRQDGGGRGDGDWGGLLHPRPWRPEKVGQRFSVKEKSLLQMRSEWMSAWKVWVWPGLPHSSQVLWNIPESGAICHVPQIFSSHVLIC